MLPDPTYAQRWLLPYPAIFLGPAVATFLEGIQSTIAATVRRGDHLWDTGSILRLSLGMKPPHSPCPRRPSGTSITELKTSRRHHWVKHFFLCGGDGSQGLTHISSATALHPKWSSRGKGATGSQMAFANFTVTARPTLTPRGCSHITELKCRCHGQRSRGMSPG